MGIAIDLIAEPEKEGHLLSHPLLGPLDLAGTVASEVDAIEHQGYR